MNSSSDCPPNLNVVLGDVFLVSEGSYPFYW